MRARLARFEDSKKNDATRAFCTALQPRCRRPGRLLAGVWGGQPLSLALRASSHFSIWDWPHFRASGSVWKLPSRSVRPLCHDTVTSQVPSLFSLICTTGGGGDVSAIGTICARFLNVATLGKPCLSRSPQPPLIAAVKDDVLEKMMCWRRLARLTR
jgi:hypothetical protein